MSAHPLSIRRAVTQGVLFAGVFSGLAVLLLKDRAATAITLGAGGALGMVVAIRWAERRNRKHPG